MCVGGALSDAFALLDMMFQGTVLGPLVWVLFSLDLPEFITLQGAVVELFADDLTVFKCFPRHTEAPIILDELRGCQAQAHQWGKLNQAQFAPSKESFVTISSTQPAGATFRLLGPMIDNRLRMHETVEPIRRKALPRLRALLRASTSFSLKTLLSLYTSQIRSVMESFQAAIYHASATVLKPLDDLQQQFLSHVGLCPEVAAADHNILPLSTRRDIAMLGLLHKRVLGTAPPPFIKLFPMRTINWGRVTRATLSRHSKQFEEPRLHTNMQRNSLLGLTRVYNRLNVYSVSAPDVTTFQTGLTEEVKVALRGGHPTWHLIFSPRREYLGAR